VVAPCPPGGDVRRSSDLAKGGAPTAAQVIVIDCSASMEFPHTKLPEAKRATVAAIDALRDGVAFALVAGADTARMVMTDVTLRPADTIVRPLPICEEQVSLVRPEPREPSSSDGCGRALVRTMAWDEEKPVTIRSYCEFVPSFPSDGHGAEIDCARGNNMAHSDPILG
jgi:hypothetical protein